MAKATIVLVHGAFEHSGRYSHLLERLRHDGYDVISEDLPGQGVTAGRKGHIRSFDDYLHKLMKWMDQADPNKPMFLLGHSMGGLVVIRTLQKFKPHVSGVILSSPALGILNGATKPLEIISMFLNVFWPTFQVDSPLKPEMVTTNPEVIKRDKEDSLMLEKVSVRWYIEFQKAIKIAFKEVEEFPNVPLLVMQAGEDLMVDRGKTNEWFHQIESIEKIYKEWPGYYHEILNELEWEQAYLYMMKFLNQQLNG
ncbi:alpha/beta hydrolase [Halobacillus seohaensis]|uniref:Alpha/beta hydrolase n=1 Tax=Halobacillus seohaensis TaxID=447421 RepID=A0ABW2ENR3_9BACI